MSDSKSALERLIESLESVLPRSTEAKAARTELSALRARVAELEECLREWTSTCACHGTGTIRSRFNAHSERPCNGDYCKKARRLLRGEEHPIAQPAPGAGGEKEGA